MAVQELDGVLNGEDVIGLLLIHFVEDRRERRGFAGASRAGHEDDAISQLHDLAQRRRQVQILESWNLVRNYTHDDRTASALFENIHTETRHACNAVR